MIASIDLALFDFHAFHTTTGHNPQSCPHLAHSQHITIIRRRVGNPFYLAVEFTSRWPLRWCCTIWLGPFLSPGGCCGKNGKGDNYSVLADDDDGQPGAGRRKLAQLFIFIIMGFRQSGRSNKLEAGILGGTLSKGGLFMSYVYAHLQTPAQFCKSKLYNFLCQKLERSF